METASIYPFNVSPPPLERARLFLFTIPGQRRVRDGEILRPISVHAYRSQDRVAQYGTTRRK